MQFSFKVGFPAPGAAEKPPYKTIEIIQDDKLGPQPHCLNFEELNKQIRDRIKKMRIDLLFDEPSTFEDENEDDKFLGENI